MKTLSCHFSFDCSPTAILVHTMCFGDKSNDRLISDRDIHIVTVVISKCIVHIVMCLDKNKKKSTIETVLRIWHPLYTKQ